MPKTWMGRRIVKDTDADRLEEAAALLEFGEGVPRSQAEDRAHRDYLADQHRRAAAHHLRGLRAAQAAGDLEEGAKHGEAYHHHMGKLGHDSMDQVPDDVKALVEADDRGTHYRFKAHGADKLLYPDEDGKKEQPDSEGKDQ